MARRTYLKENGNPPMPYQAPSGRVIFVGLKRYISKTMGSKLTVIGLGLVVLLGYVGFMKISLVHIKHTHNINKMKLVNRLHPTNVHQNNALSPTIQQSATFKIRAGIFVPVPDILIAPDATNCGNIDEIVSANRLSSNDTDSTYSYLITKADQEIQEGETDPYEFIETEREPYLDIHKLQKKIIYPDLAKRAKIEGKVNIRVLVKKDGIPKKCFIESTDSDLLNEAAQQSVMGSVFTPAIQNNQPIDCWTSVCIMFRMR